LKTEISFETIMQDEPPALEFVHSQFHKGPITGLDVCLRKQLIVTCEAKTINIWNYATKQLEISWQSGAGEEAAAVAFHPSGFHLVVAFGDKIQFMNVLSNTIKDYLQVPLK